MTVADGQTLEGANLTFLWNYTYAIGEKISETGRTPNAGNVTMVANETKDVPGTPTVHEFRFNTSFLFGENVPDNRTIFFTAFGCNNQTNNGNCSFATTNVTMEVVASAPDITRPIVTLQSPNNGTVFINNSLNITVDVSDDVELANITLFLNGSTIMYDMDTEVAYIENNSFTQTADKTGYQFNFSEGMLPNASWSEFIDGNINKDGFIYGYVEARDTNNTRGASDNFTIEFDSTPPGISAHTNTTLTVGACQTANVNFTVDEPANISGFYYPVKDGVTANVSITQNLSFAFPDVVTNLTNLINNERYYYNYSICDEHGNCNDSDSALGIDEVQLQGDFTFGWSLCEGWSQYGILESSINTSALGESVGADFISFWQIENDSFDTLTVASQSLGGHRLVGRGEAILIHTTEDKAWVRNAGENFTSPGANGTDVFFDAGWNHVGLLQDRTPKNISDLQDFPFAVDGESNITFISAYNNNITESSFRDWIFNRSRNFEMTAPLREGYAPWFFMAAGSNLTARSTWWNRTSYFVNQSLAQDG